MNYALIKPCDIANGVGVRVSLFVSGCSHRCKGCFNPETWDFAYGEPFTEETQEYILKLMDKPQISGLTLLGGDPMEKPNQEALLALLGKAKERFPQKDIWCFTGYDFEKDVLAVQMKEWQSTPAFLSFIDVLVDGPFVEEQKDLNLRFKGSANQRTILVNESLKKGKTIVWTGEKT